MELSPRRELPLPPSVSPPLPPKFGARARSGMVGCAPLGHLPGPEAVPGCRCPTYPATEPPPAGADPTFRGRGPARAASARNFALLSAGPGRSGSGRGRRRGGKEARPRRFARWAGSGARRAPSCAASKRSCLAPSPFGPSPRAAGSGGGFLNCVQGARGALLLLLFSLTPPSSHPCAPGNLGTFGEVGAARAARRASGWKQGRRGRS